MRELFEIPDDVAYFNCAYMSPQLCTVSAAGERAVRRKALPWKLSSQEMFFDEAETLRRLAAKLLGSDVDGIAIVPSASYGLQVAANNLPLEAGENIVVLEEQFPSNVYPWRVLARKKGAHIVTAPRTTDGVLGAIDERTAIVAVPNYHWTDGMGIDLVRIRARARALVVDISQSFGAAEFDLSTIKPDFVVSVGYKWQLGPLGTAYLYVAPKYRDGEPIENNWLNRADSDKFSRLVDYRDDFQAGARRFDVGGRSNMVTLPMAIAALTQIDQWGIPFIARELRKKTDRLEAELTQRGFLCTKHRGPHFLGARRPGADPLKLQEALARANVFVSVRGDMIRVSPHLYNTDDDISRLVLSLPQ